MLILNKKETTTTTKEARLSPGQQQGENKVHYFLARPHCRLMKDELPAQSSLSLRHEVCRREKKETVIRDSFLI